MNPHTPKEWLTEEIQKAVDNPDSFRNKELQVLWTAALIHARENIPWEEYATLSSKGGVWVKVDDKLPNEGELILCWREGDTIPDSYYASTGAYGFFNKGVWGNEEKDNWKVTHWMPLPNPPGDETPAVEKTDGVEVERLKKELENAELEIQRLNYIIHEKY